jgi:hypothetical protein
MSDTARDQAIAQCQSIVGMVAALTADYARRDELRDERDAFEVSDEYDTAETRAAWALANPDDAAELQALDDVCGECNDADEARQRIQEDALSVEVRSGWASPGEKMESEEFRIVLCTGGPHVEIVGDLDRSEPSRPRVIFKDWGDSGELFDFDHDAVLAYCGCFYFGE